MIGWCQMNMSLVEAIRLMMVMKQGHARETLSEISYLLDGEAVS